MVLPDPGAAVRHTLLLEYVLVAASGPTAYAHAQASSRAGLAVFGALTGATALGSLFVGMMLAN